MVDFRTARLNMVESQIRPNGITDRRITAAMLEVPREAFVPHARQALAYIDEDVPITDRANGPDARYLMEPMVFARLVQLASIAPSDLVLDIGCGLGYSTAILARLAESVVALEADETLAAEATERLVEQGVMNAAVVTGQLAAGFPQEGPYDVIFLGGAVGAVPQALFDQLKDGGRMVAVIDGGPIGKATLFSRHNSAMSSRTAFDASVGRLPGFEAREPGFVF